MVSAPPRPTGRWAESRHLDGRDAYDALIDARGLSCPLPLVKARQALMVLPAGARICVLATDPAAPRDFEEFAEVTGHQLTSSGSRTAFTCWWW